MRGLGTMSPEERQVAGPTLNALRDDLTAALAEAKARLADAALDARVAAEWADVTLPGRPVAQGTIHPVSQVTDEVVAIFADLGFSVAEGPQVESDWYNFDALNIPPEHPARQEHDTFYMARVRRRQPAAARAAHPHLAGADPGDAGAGRADPGDRAGPGLPRRLRPDAHADVPPGRGARASTATCRWRT